LAGEFNRIFSSLFLRNSESYKKIVNVLSLMKWNKKLKRPKGLSCRPILIHVNGVHDSVVESSYFSDIIDFSQAFDGG
jgi:hypothetical protein